MAKKLDPAAPTKLRNLSFLVVNLTLTLTLHLTFSIANKLDPAAPTKGVENVD
jgi:hypothetical protein